MRVDQLRRHRRLPMVPVIGLSKRRVIERMRSISKKSVFHRKRCSGCRYEFGWNRDHQAVSGEIKGVNVQFFSVRHYPFVKRHVVNRQFDQSFPKGQSMTALNRHPLLTLGLGILLGAGFMVMKPQTPVKAASANSNDKFSMATVPVTAIGDSEAVFILDHLTGVLRGGVVSPQTGGFANTYLRNVAADFQVNPATPEPKYSMVGGPINLRSSGGSQPATGVLYIAELTSGGVIAYGFAQPRGRGSAVPMELVRLDGFSFREAVGG